MHLTRTSSTWSRFAFFAGVGLVLLCLRPSAAASVAASDALAPNWVGDDALSVQDHETVGRLYRQLTQAENAHDVQTVEKLLWRSPSALLVSKSATPAEGNWSGVWGDKIVIEHLRDLLHGTFHIEPDYGRMRVVGLAHDVAETYSPVTISVSYGGQNPSPKPFLIIINWLRTSEGWKMATDIALPVPPAANQP